MDGYKGRKAPNVSHYLANLNALPSAHEVAIQQQEEFNIDDELAQFTNTEFLDFDAGDFLEQPMPEYDPSLEEKARRENAAANKKIGGQGMHFVTGMLHIALASAPEQRDFYINKHLSLWPYTVAPQHNPSTLPQHP